MALSKDEIKQKFNSMPDPVADILYSDETHNIIIDIGRKHALHIDQIGILSDAITDVVVGFTPSAEFIEKLSHELPDVPHETINEIAEDINATVFRDVRKALMTIEKSESDEYSDAYDNTPPPSMQFHGVTPITPNPHEIEAAGLDDLEKHLNTKQASSFDFVGMANLSTTTPTVSEQKNIAVQTNSLPGTKEDQTPTVKPLTDLSTLEEHLPQTVAEKAITKPIYKNGDPYREPI